MEIKDWRYMLLLIVCRSCCLEDNLDCEMRLNLIHRTELGHFGNWVEKFNVLDMYN